MTPHGQMPAPTLNTTHSRRSLVRLLLGVSLGSVALAVSACASGPVEPPRYRGGNGNDRDRGGHSS